MILPTVSVAAGLLVFGFAGTAIFAAVVYKLKQKERGIRVVLAREAEQRLHRFHPASRRHHPSSATAPAV